MSWAYQWNISEAGCQPDDPVEVNDDSYPSYFSTKKSERIVIVSWVFWLCLSRCCTQWVLIHFMFALTNRLKTYVTKHFRISGLHRRLERSQGSKPNEVFSWFGGFGPAWTKIFLGLAGSWSKACWIPVLMASAAAFKTWLWDHVYPFPRALGQQRKMLHYYIQNWFIFYYVFKNI